MQLNRNEKAKEILDKTVANPPIDASIGVSNPGYTEYQLLQMHVSAAQKYVSMKYPLDALRLVISSKEDKELHEKARRWSGNESYYLQQLTTIETQARQQITPEMLESMLVSELALKPSGAGETQAENDAEKKDASLKSILLEVSFKENKKGKSTAECLLTQLLTALPKKEKNHETLKRIVTEAMAVPLKNRSLGQLIMLSLYCQAH